MPSPKSRPKPPDAGGELVPVGYFTKAHGIRGEVVMVLEAESAEILSSGLFARPRHGGEYKALRVTGMRRHHGNLLISLEGVNNRNEADLLRSHTVFVPEASLPPLDEDEIYLKDLPGLTVFVREESGERELGVIREASAPAGQDIWTIITGDGKEILFPAVEDFVLAIEPDKGRALISPPPGLLDLYLAD